MLMSMQFPLVHPRSGVPVRLLLGILLSHEAGVLALPDSGTSSVLPRGHSMDSIAFVTALIPLARNTDSRWLALVLETLFTLILALSRANLGVHYPKDVLTGWLTGVAWAHGVCDVFIPCVIQTIGAES